MPGWFFFHAHVIEDIRQNVQQPLLQGISKRSSFRSLPESEMYLFETTGSLLHFPPEPVDMSSLNSALTT